MTNSIRTRVICEPVAVEQERNSGHRCRQRLRRLSRDGDLVSDFDHIVTTTFAARQFTDRAVTDAEIVDILNVARFAPSGGNRQGWRVVVLRDPSTKRAVLAAGEPQVQRVVGFPAQVAIAAVVPLGEPTQVLTKLRRDPVESFARFDHWTGPPVQVAAA